MKPKKGIVFKLPFDQDGKPVLEAIEKVDFDFKVENGRPQPPIPVDDWKLIHDIKNTTVILHENNPYCYTIWSEGAWITR